MSTAVIAEQIDQDDKASSLPGLSSEEADGASLAEQHDRVFAGTSIASGTGRAIVTAIGMATELGRIAKLLETAQEDTTPLQRRLAQVSRTLARGRGLHRSIATDPRADARGSG